MEKVTASTELFTRGELVALKDGRLGRAITEKGQSFRLSDMISEGAKFLGADKFSEVYIRTRKLTKDVVDTINLYLLNDQGQLFDANESKKRGQIVLRQFSKSEVAQAIVTIGKPFHIPGRGLQTTEVVEIIAATNKVYPPDSMRNLTKGKTNGIIEEFENGLPPDFEAYIPFSRV